VQLTAATPLDLPITLAMDNVSEQVTVEAAPLPETLP
jgi:hypothetical protein